MSESEPNVWSKFKDLMGGTVVKTVTEIHSLMPDSILFGSLLMYFLTQNAAFGIFSVFILETVLSHKLISWVSAQAVGPSRSTNVQCRPGFKMPQFRPERVFSHDTYPSYSVFSLTSIATYLAMATSQFSSTLDAMGGSWPARKIMAYVFTGIVLAVFIGVRFLYCDSFSEIMMAAIFGAITASILFAINKAIFGEEAMNFLGLPYMVSKESEGSPIYVCAATDPTSA